MRFLSLVFSSRFFLSGFVLLAALCLLLLTGCTSPATVTPTPTVPSTVVSLSLRTVLASSDLSVGSNRVVFALIDSNNAPVKAGSAMLALAHEQDGGIVQKGELEAGWRSWPAGPGGVFTVQIEFDKAGLWLAQVSPADGAAEGRLARMVMRVSEESSTPALGSPAPASLNRTASSVASLDELTSDVEPDPDLYSITIAEALQAGKPLVVAFATPAFCTSATCGPQVDVVKKLKEDYREQANFIHVEVFANPHEMRSDITKGVLSPTFEEWGLPSEPWVFVIDAQRRVSAKFDGFVSYEELEQALQRVI